MLVILTVFGFISLILFFVYTNRLDLFNNFQNMITLSFSVFGYKKSITPMAWCF